MTRVSQKAFAVFAAVWSASYLPLAAQITTGEITGTVTDSAGAVIVGAVVTATNPATGTQRTVNTSSGGCPEFR